jgi:hypothetical protein
VKGGHSTHAGEWRDRDPVVRLLSPLEPYQHVEHVQDVAQVLGISTEEHRT